ncbi:MAG: ribosome maturation factor RimP [Leptolyngbya sp. SIO4C1]|nr:ribosome maturation factor RimP [Leptolyngbya sp. SIO4C1]
MTHPVIPQVIELATPIADQLGLEIVDAIFQTNHSPPVLRVDVRNLTQDDTGLDDCEQMSIALSDCLDTANLLPDAYVLEVSSPGVSDMLSSDRDFAVFKGFPVEVQLSEPYKGKRTWVGKLVERNEEKLRLNQKGRAISLPRPLVQSVRLSSDSDS